MRDLAARLARPAAAALAALPAAAVTPVAPAAAQQVRGAVRGVLWVDGATAAPRAFAFDYRWPRALVPADVAARYGGEIDFATLHSGTVVVRQWALSDFAVRAGTLVATGGSGATTLAAVRVTERAAPPEPSARALMGGRGRAMVFDRATIARRTPARLSDLLRGHAYLVVADDGTVTTRDRIFNDDKPGTACPFQLFVNGRVYDGGTVDDFSPGQVARLEVYASAASLPATYAGRLSGCGVIAVWSEEPRPARG